VSAVPAAPVLALMAFGVLLAIAGSLVRSTTVQAAGLALLFLATAAMVVGAFVAFEGDERDPRPTTPRSAAPAQSSPGSGGSARPALRIRSPAAASAAASANATNSPHVMPTG
jgi:hypothetical protein